MKANKKAPQTIIPSRSLMPQRRHVLRRQVEEMPTSRGQSFRNALAEPGLGCDFGQVQVHSDAKAESCPLATGSRFCPFGGACHSCPPRVQAKLTIGQPNDRYEREADRVAEQVMRMPEPRLQRRVEPEEEKEEEELIQPKENGSAPTKVAPAIGSSINSLKGGGQPLPDSVRGYFERRIGYDFGEIRIHNEPRAAEIAGRINAQAFAVGKHIFLGSSEMGYGKRERRLLAHELAHTLQSDGARRVRRRTWGEAREERESRRGTRSRRGASTSDFCVPYATAAEARAARSWLDRYFRYIHRVWFGSEVRDLWLDYLYGRAGSTRRVISGSSSDIVEGFEDSDTTEDYQEQVLDDAVSSMARRCPSVAARSWVSVPVTTAVPGYNANPPMNFRHITEIPGNIAGGISGSSFGPDSRHVSGNIRFLRRTDSQGDTTSVVLETDLDFVVRDAIDFCPGGPGAPLEQQVTVPLSRLEAMGWTRDLGYEVRFSGPAERRHLSRSEISRCWSAAAPPQPIFFCFVGDARITLSDGSTSRIADVREGQEVLAFDEQTGQIRECKVVRLVVHDPGLYLQIGFVNGQKLGVTNNHPVYCDGKWIPAGNLQPGDMVWALASDLRGVNPLEVGSSKEVSEAEPLYDLTITDCHTFFAEGILVHNKVP